MAAGHPRRDQGGRLAGRLALVLAVLGWHLALLDWLGQSLPTASVLKPVAQAMYTREIVQTAVQTASPLQHAKKKQPSRHIPSTSLATVPIASSSTQTTTIGELNALNTSPDSSTPYASDTPATPIVAPESTVTPQAATDNPNANDWPANTRLNYGLSGFYRGPVKGDARVLWQKDQDRYQVVVDIDLGIVGTRMTSQGTIGKDRLEPRVYEEKTGPTLRSLLLDPTRIRLNGGEWVERPPEVQDTASQFVELAHRFTAQPSLLAVGKAVPVWLARPGGVDEWTYDVVALEDLHSAHLGTVPAYHLKPRPLAKPRGPVTAEIWFAPSLQFLPVRIRLAIGTEAWLDLMVEKIEQQ